MSPRTPVAQGKAQLNGITDNLHLMGYYMRSKHRLEGTDKIFIKQTTCNYEKSPEIFEGANQWRALLNVTSDGGIEISHSSVVEDSILARCGTVSLDMGLPTFQ
jgi:hypothetical protein